ncbi:uncharacterized protein LOC109853551 [Pseudomyrmex gracilis]|uniref:uncharacterized protein LOC109853551 n=1 Tax=Pseudomyrmex gracilis TaxID=219809 RepID=UPI000994ED35|nr:uncharacterized protein LOC109853551 [Pseudomyrmex gracilis]
MKTIGRILSYVLLAAAFAKNVLTISTANVKFLKVQSDEVARDSNGTRLELISGLSLNSNILGNHRNDLNNMFQNEVDQEKSRTFGHKRLQLMLMPMMYKMGVMMTMLMVLTAISVKGLLIGVILLVLKLSTFLAKLHSGHSEHSYPSAQPIHVHVHNSFPHLHPYHAWESIPASGPGDDAHYYYKG